MLATSRREFFDVVLNASTPQGWSAVDYTSSDDSSNPADELKSKNAAEDGFIASQKTTTNATSTKEQLEPQTPSSPDSADPRSSRPAAAASLVQQNTPHCLEQRNSEYKIASRSKFTFADGDTELNKTNRNGKYQHSTNDGIVLSSAKSQLCKDNNYFDLLATNLNECANLHLALYGERALWRVGKLKRPKRRSKNSLRWKPAVNIGTQEGATSYDAGVIWLPVQESSSNQNTSASDARQPCPKAVYSSKQPQTELKTEETSASPKTNENPTSPPPDIKIKIEEVPENRSMSVPCGTRDKSKQKAGKFY
ncbi:hypothetical protein TRICI_001726 [Trichomonascus ciferrii]|uniref:Uncharacterized protein n=1 Tax=Trichomonascus ciferrii TaxID=44093 RepID=A0A642V7S8_9ASCO|nr:hypothetical protein TRICI_001726 [Trichomonascus ciferrii]